MDIIDRVNRIKDHFDNVSVEQFEQNLEHAGMNNSEETCWDCGQRIGEECGIDGHEVYPDDKACNSFEVF